MAPRSEIRAVLVDAVGTLVALREPVGETYARMERDVAGARARAARMRAIDVGSLATLCELPDRLGALATTDLGPPDE